VTDKDFRAGEEDRGGGGVAARLGGGALEGTPQDDLRFAYIKYDKLQG
jgi:hypothetical protein